MSVVLWMFSLDHHQYARWLPAHIRAMLNLPNTQPQIYSSFEDGKFTKCSRMALDQNHEQRNARIKGTGGAIGLTENDTSLRRWLASEPEVALLFDEFTFFWWRYIRASWFASRNTIAVFKRCQFPLFPLMISIYRWQFWSLCYRHKRCKGKRCC